MHVEVRPAGTLPSGPLLGDEVRECKYGEYLSVIVRLTFDVSTAIFV